MSMSGSIKSVGDVGVMAYDAIAGWFGNVLPTKWAKAGLLGIPLLFYGWHLDGMAAFLGFQGCVWLTICKESATKEKNADKVARLYTKIINNHNDSVNLADFQHFVSTTGSPDKQARDEGLLFASEIIAGKLKAKGGED